MVGVTGAAIILLVLADGTDTGSTSGPSTTSGVIKLILGVLCLGLARRNFRAKPGADGEGELPAWLTSIESITPARRSDSGCCCRR